MIPEDKQHLNMMIGVTVITAISFVMICSQMFGLVDALGYLSAIFILAVIGGVTLQRIEDKQKAGAP